MPSPLFMGTIHLNKINALYHKIQIGTQRVARGASRLAAKVVGVVLRDLQICGRTCTTRTTCRTIVSRNLQCAKHTTLCQFQAKKSYASYASCTSYRISLSAKHPPDIHPFSLSPKKNQRHLAYEMALFELCGNPVRMFSEARERRADMPKHPPSSIHPQLSFRDGRTPPTLRSTDNS